MTASRRVRSLGVACVAATTAALVMINATWAPDDRAAHALPKFDPPGIEGGGVSVGCLDNLPLVGEVVGLGPRMVGYPVVGFTVELDATAVKVRWGAGCGADFIAPAEQFVWAIESRPLGSIASLSNDGTLAPRLRLDRAGTYQISLTVCPSGCTMLQGSQTVHIPTRHFGVTIQSVLSAPLAPETVPVLPSLPQVARTEQPRDNCGTGAGVIAAQWWAVEQITTPDDYRLLEGEVTRSRVSRRDTPLNHDSQDVNFNVFPDPPYRDLFFAGSEERSIEVEWETASLPEFYRPTLGDRMSVWGHWIYDCAHSTKTEIHPPVGVAVHRPRPISISAETTFEEFGGGSVTGAYVPGVVTDVFFSRRAGALVDCSIDTGLKNAELIVNPGQTVAPACIPPPSLDREFTFNIYLPRNPRVTMAHAGFNVPPVPLYVADSTPPGELPGPAPSIQRFDTEDGVTYLTVRIDLRGYGPMHYKRRIAAGWVLPSENNWSLARWRLLLHQLDILNDGDGSARGDGDWRLWMNTNNASSEWLSPVPRQEWVQILNQDVHGVESFGGQAWETALDAPRSLGPDLLRYPAPVPGTMPLPEDRGILFHTTGYESDGLVDDDAGTILVSVPPKAASYVEQNRCSISTVFEFGPFHYYSGCVEYKAAFEVAPGPALPPAALSAGAQAVASAYVLSCPRAAGGDDVGVGVCEGILAPSVPVPPIQLLDASLAPGSEPIDISVLGPFHPGEREFALTEVSGEAFYRIVERTQRTDPERVGRLLAGMRRAVDSMLTDGSLAQDAQAELTMLRVLLPGDLWSRHFGDIPRAPQNPDVARARLTGSSTVAAAPDPVRAQDLVLHCDVQRQPNTLSVRWGANRFDLDLALEASCEAGGESFEKASGWSLQEGRGIGRYNGIPGALIEWRFVDGGEPAGGRDSAALTIVTDGGVVLQVSGGVTRGNINAHPN